MQTDDVTVGGSADVQRAVKRLSRVSTARGVSHLGEIWLVVGLAVWSSAWAIPHAAAGLSAGWATFVSVVGYVLAVATVASRQHALMVLGHEAIHKRLSSTSRINDGLGRYVATFPVFISLSKWAFIHLRHHRHTHTADDPDRAIYARYPLAAKKFRRLLLRDVCGLNVISTLKYFADVPFVTGQFNRRFLGEEGAARYAQGTDMRRFTLFWAAVLAAGFGAAGWTFGVLFLLYWLVPYCTLMQVFFRIRGAIEHGHVPDPDNAYQRTRTYFMPAALRFFFAPKQVGYHLEHHLYPSIPFYSLPRIHDVLKRAVYPREAGYVEPFRISLQKLVRG